VSLPIKQFLLGSAVDKAMERCRILRDTVSVFKSQIDSGSKGSDEVLNLMRGIKIARDQLSAYAAAPGIDVQAREQYNDPALNFSTELTAIVTACDNCLSWVSANFPKDANGWLLKDKIVDGAIDNRVFTQAQLVTFSTTLGTLLATFS
jgi:hypothetical protein